MAAGRPSKYKVEYAKQAIKLCKLGATDVEMSEFFGISEKTFNTWKSKYPKFLQSLKNGKEEADARVIRSLYQRAIGYSHPEEKVFCNMGEISRAQTTKHYPPETVACIFWLKNRKPEEWRDRHEINQNINVTHASELSDEELESIAAGGIKRNPKKARSQKKSNSIH